MKAVADSVGFVGVDSRHIDEERLRAHRLEDTVIVEKGGANVAGVGEHGDDELGAASRFGCRAGGDAPVFGVLGERVGIEVEAADGMPAA